MECLVIFEPPCPLVYVYGLPAAADSRTSWVASQTPVLAVSRGAQYIVRSLSSLYHMVTILEDPGNQLRGGLVRASMSPKPCLAKVPKLPPTAPGIPPHKRLRPYCRQ